jgi:hypothetical protein
MGGQLSVPQVMLSAPRLGKRNAQYSKAISDCNDFFQKKFIMGGTIKLSAAA